MILYSGQNFDMRTFRERIDFKKGTYGANDTWEGMPNVRLQQEALIARIGHDQFIWCSTTPPESKTFGHSNYRYQHQLDVDPRNILFALEGWIWQYLLWGDDSTFIPHAIHQDFYGEFDSVDLDRNRAWVKGNAEQATVDRLLRPYCPQLDIGPTDDALVSWPLLPTTRILSVKEVKK